ncbi:MAG: hypothetical protein QM660_09010 [Dysgonomonas sp.]
MNFKYSCIGDNTPENRQHCKVLGLEKHSFSHERGDMIATYTDTKSNISFYLISWKDIDMLKPDIVNCIGNPELFRAVTAMRDDSDYIQWFRMEKSTIGFEFWYL